MVTTRRTTSTDKDFLKLIKLLDNELWNRYPELQVEYEQHVKLDLIETVLVAYMDDKAVGCGCFVAHNNELIEIRRMFVHPESRGKGISRKILNALELWAAELGYKTAILETGHKQPEALHLYKSAGYEETERYEPFKDLENSSCFRKTLKAL